MAKATPHPSLMQRVYVLTREVRIVATGVWGNNNVGPIAGEEFPIRGIQGHVSGMGRLIRGI